MKKFKAWQTYFLFIFILSVFLITGCGGGGETGRWLPGNPDTARPRVTATVPLTTIGGPTLDVPYNIAAITAAFNEEMLPASITAGSFTVTGPGGIPYQAP